MTIKPTTRRHKLLGLIALFNLAVTGLFWLASMDQPDTEAETFMIFYWGCAALTFLVMAFACLKPAVWARKWALLTAIFILGSSAYNLFFVTFMGITHANLGLIFTAILINIGPLFVGHLFYRFAASDEKKPSSTKIVYSGSEFSPSSLQNYGLFIVFLAALVGGIYLWWQSLF